MILNKYFYRNIWNTEEDLLATYKSLYKQKTSTFSVNTFPDYEIIYENKGPKFWYLGEYLEDINKVSLWTMIQRKKLETEPSRGKINYLASDVFISFLRNNFRSTETWGVEIGKPYYALSSYLSPVSIKNISYLIILLKKQMGLEWFENMTSNYDPLRMRYATIRKREKLFLYQIGNSEAFRKAYAFLYKFGIKEEHLDGIAHSAYSYLSTEHLEDYLKILDFSRLSRLLWSLDMQNQSQERILERAARWERLRLLKTRKYEDQKNSWGFFTLLIKILVFLRSYDRVIK